MSGVTLAMNRQETFKKVRTKSENLEAENVKKTFSLVKILLVLIKKLQIFGSEAVLLNEMPAFSKPVMTESMSKQEHETKKYFKFS